VVAAAVLLQTATMAAVRYADGWRHAGGLLVLGMGFQVVMVGKSARQGVSSK
jgi:hypothetical protein